ncbi:hypothetical protein AGMMS49992_15220 [Clostridia bacterium]|nr:hypothetical protein AGMMS49992_15220 [Clostridia bacterium]
MDGRTEIQEYALYEGYKIQTVILPDTITDIGNWALRKCNTLVTIGTTTEKISGVAFLPNDLKSVNYYAFADCASLSDIRFQSIGAAAIAEGAFIRDHAIKKHIFSKKNINSR